MLNNVPYTALAVIMIKEAYRTVLQVAVSGWHRG